MDAERWARLKELFHAVLERDVPQRSAFLDAACRGDPALRAEVERLLSAHARTAGFIEHPPAAATLSGRTLGRYEVGRLIGVGGMGEVYAARDLELGRAVALKIASGSDPDAHARLLREAQHASQLNHPHICTIHEIGDADGQPYIVMEYVEGTQLADLIPPGGLPMETLLRYGVQIADALAHAHLRGVTHRDLKAANIVVTPEGRTKVLDFGLARSFSPQSLKDLSKPQPSMTAAGLVAGTLFCMAPDVLRGEPPDQRSDIWALGVLLYEMSTGERPFTGATEFELVAAILHEPPASMPPRVPPALQTIIQRCLAKDPRERYQQTGEVRSALETVQSAPAGAIRGGRARLAVAALLIGLVAAAGLTWRMVRPVSVPAPAAMEGRPSIAVMPFDRVGAQDPDGEWMSNGVPSMLLTGLAQTRGLDIVGTERLNDVLRQRGGTSLGLLDKSQAADVARRAGARAVVIGKFPGVEQGYTFASQLYRSRPGRPGNPQKLLALLSSGVSALPNSGNMRNVYGYGLLDVGRYAEAIREFEVYVELAPREPNPYDSLAEAHLMNGSADKALEYYSRALTIDPTFHGAHDGRAWSLAVLGRYDESLAETPPTQSLRAFILSRVGRYKDAAAAIALGIEEAARLLVEQKLPFARRVASEFRILEKGRCIAGGSIGELTDDLVHAHLSV